jgi:transcriptional regulator of acetoin/glycerol metabolism
MRSPWVGVDLAADQLAWARLLRSARELMLAGRGRPAILREVIARSWERCIENRVDPHRPAARLLDEQQTRAQLDGHPLAGVLPALSELLAQVTHEARHLVLISDAHGLLLWAEGHAGML